MVLRRSFRYAPFNVMAKRCNKAITSQCWRKLLVVLQHYEASTDHSRFRHCSGSKAHPANDGISTADRTVFGGSHPADAIKHGFSGAVQLAAFMAYCIWNKGLLRGENSTMHNLMFVPFIIRRSRNNQHIAHFCTTALFIYAGSYMFRQ
jgi:hypothetical protein